MSLEPAQLEKAIRDDDAAQVRELLADATEGERAACAKALKSLLKGPGFPDFGPIMMIRPEQILDLVSGRLKPPEPEGAQREQQQRYDEWRELASGLGFQLALLGLAGGAKAAEEIARDLQPDWKGYADPEVRLFAAVLADRRPAWLADLVARRLRAYGEWRHGLNAWLLARHLIRLGAIAKPDNPEYTTLLPWCLVRTGLPGHGLVPGPTPAISEVLAAEPDLLADEVWRLFAVPDAGRALEQADGRGPGGPARQTWVQALALLSAEGHLDRGRLIDACIDAFSADFHPSRVGWYATMLAELDPTIDEMAARPERYVGLLATTSKVGVVVGQAGIRKLLEAGQLDVRLLLDGSAPAMLFQQKSIAMAQIKLIDLVIAKVPDSAAAAVAAVTTAFGHQRQDVQEAALALIAKHGIPAGAPLAEIRLRALDLAPGLLARAAQIGVAAPAPGSDRESESGADLAAELGDLEQRIAALPDVRQADLKAALATVRTGGMPGPAAVRPEPGASLAAPVTDPDELVQLLATLMEDARDAIAVERAIAAAVRLSALGEDERRRIAGPLLKRAKSISGESVQFIGDRLTCDVALITIAWATGRLPGDSYGRSGYSYHPGKVAVDGSGRAIFMTGIFSARAWESAKLVGTGRGGLLLAEPETERGTISHDCLRNRLAQLDGTGAGLAGRHDLDAALLRLAPDAPDSLWPVLGRLTGRAPQVLADSHRAVASSLTFEYVSGNPQDRYGRGALGERLYARLTEPVPAAPDCAGWQLMTRLTEPIKDHGLLSAAGQYETDYAAAIAGWPLICPWQPEVTAGHLLRPLADGLYSKAADAATAITALNHPGTPLGPVGHLASLTGLGSIQPDTQIAAAQLWAEAAADGRLDPALAAAALTAGVRAKALKLNRITGALRHVHHSAIASRRVVEFVCAGADELVSANPANLGALIELAAQFAASAGRPDLPTAMTQLAGKKGSSRIAVTAGQLAQAGHGPAPRRQQAAIEALTALAIRAEAGNS